MTERTFSFEFFPPKTEEGAEKLRATRKQLAQLNPKFFSVTFGAGGSTRDRTLETVREIQAAGSEAAPHLSCIGSTEASIRDILNEYKSQGIRHLVALRGDLPSGTMDAGEFNYANELVAFIRKETGDWFEIEVAAYPEVHPQARSWTEDLANFKRKVDAGADAAITQYFFNGDATNLLADRLRDLEANGVIERRLAENGRAITYALTPWGAQLREPIEGLIRWSTPLMIRGPEGDTFPTGGLLVALPALFNGRVPTGRPSTVVLTVNGDTHRQHVQVQVTGSGIEVSRQDDREPHAVLSADAPIILGL